MAQKFRTAISFDGLGSASSQAIAARVDGDSANRLLVDAGGKLTWGDGSVAGDVNLYRSAANVLKTDDVFVAGSGVVTLTSSGVPSVTIDDGALAVDSVGKRFYFRAGGAWETVASGATISESPPSSPLAGDLWFDSDTGDVFIFYDGVWVDIGGSSLANIAVTSTPPAVPVNGDLWFDADSAKTYVYYDDGTSGQWIEIGAASAAAAGTDGAIQFSTGGTFDSSANLVWDDANNELEVGGNIVPTASETYDLGSSTNRFRDLYLSGSSIVLGGITLSTDGTSLSVGAGEEAEPFATEAYVDSANVASATKLATSRTISLTGDVTGSASFDGTANASITTTVADDSHNHSSSSGNFTVNGDLGVTGNLTVSGTTTTLNTTELLVEDNLITLSSGQTGTPLVDSGIEVERGTSPNVAIKWSEADDQWHYTNDGTLYDPIGTPPGAIIQYGGTAEPQGWLLCDGREVSRTTYARLFASLGGVGSYPYGLGNGSTTFNLPNMKGKVAVGRDTGDTSFDDLGETGGAKTHTLTIDEMPSHSHTQNSHNHTQNQHRHSINHDHGSFNTVSGGSHSHQHNRSSNGVFSTSGVGVQYQSTGFVADSIPTAFSDHAHTIDVPNYSGNSGYTTPTNNATTATNQNTGGGSAHNNLQPYIVVNYLIKV